MYSFWFGYSDYRVDEMTKWQQFWLVILCIGIVAILYWAAGWAEEELLRMHP